MDPVGTLKMKGTHDRGPKHDIYIYKVNILTQKW